VRELPEHLTAGPVLENQRIFAADARAPRNVDHLDQQQIAGSLALHLRGPAVHDAMLGVDVGRGQLELVREGDAGGQHASDDILELPVVAEQLEQRAPEGAVPADAEQVFPGGVDPGDEQIAIEDDSPGIEVIDDFPGQGLLGRPGPADAVARQCGWTIEVC
jgi:hypothetical protein